LKELSGADSVMLARPALYNTSIFRTRARRCQANDGESETSKTGNSVDDASLLPKHQVIQEYLQEAIRWEANPQNVKYVICEMMSSRRTPINRVTSLPQYFPGNQAIGSVCACKTIPELCWLWDVNMSLGCKLTGSSNYGVTMSGSVTSDAIKVAATEKTYDDSYFLEPETFRNKNSRIDDSSNVACYSRKEKESSSNDDGCGVRGSCVAEDDELITKKRVRVQ